MNNPPRVLVGTVTYEGKDYVWDKFYSNIKTLEYPNYDFVIVDNTESKSYYSKLKRRGVNAFHVKRGANSRIAFAKSMNKLRELFLQGDYDYLMIIESDLIPPKDIIQRLLSHQKDVVGCMYNIGLMNSKTVPPRPCLFTLNKETMRTENIPPEEGFFFFGNGLVKVHGCGLGTTLVRKNILEQFKFWYYLGDEDDKTPKHSDVLFYMDLYNNRRDVFVDTDIFIPHYNQDWRTVKDI